jgi:hypothetical protein
MTKIYSFVIPVSDDEVARNNILASPLFQTLEEKEIIIQKGYASAAKAYNSAIDKAEAEIIIFVHQDIVLPVQWADNLNASLAYLEKTNPTWGVLGCHGETQDGKGRGYLYCAGNGRYILQPFDRPEKVHTLDEIVLIIKKSSGLRFDERLPHFHLYGTDICMTAHKNGMNCYAIPAFCLHNSNETVLFPEEFFICCNYVRQKWSDSLPIYTPCVTIIRNKYLYLLKEKYIRKLKYLILSIIRHNGQKRKRLDKPIEYLRELKQI